MSYDVDGGGSHGVSHVHTYHKTRQDKTRQDRAGKGGVRAGECEGKGVCYRGKGEARCVCERKVR